MENYLLKHSQELSEKYSGKYVAVVGDKLVAINNSAVNAFKIAKGKYPDEKVCISYIPTEEETVTLL